MTKSARDVIGGLLLGAGADNRNIDKDIDYAFAEFDRAGFVIAPREPTYNMGQQGMTGLDSNGYGITYGDAVAVYKRMIACAHIDDLTLK